MSNVSGDHSLSHTPTQLFSQWTLISIINLVLWLSSLIFGQDFVHLSPEIFKKLRCSKSRLPDENLRYHCEKGSDQYLPRQFNFLNWDNSAQPAQIPPSPPNVYLDGMGILLYCTDGLSICPALTITSTTQSVWPVWGEPGNLKKSCRPIIRYKSW